MTDLRWLTRVSYKLTDCFDQPIDYDRPPNGLRKLEVKLAMTF